MMTLTVRPLHPVFAAEVTGVDLSRPVDGAVFQRIVAAMDEYAVCVFPGQTLSDDQQIAFSKNFGDLEVTRQLLRKDSKLRLDKHMADISNIDELSNDLVSPDHRRWISNLANRLWHTDSSFKPTPAKYSLLSARTIPGEGGETQFADLRAAWDALPEKRKRQIDDMVALHAFSHSRAKIGFDNFSKEELAGEPPVPQRVVRTHPGSGRKSLYLASHAMEIVGMPVPEGRLLLASLIEHATQPRFVYTHTWKVDDLVIWDNRCTMHRATEFDMGVKRDMHRTTIIDDGPTMELEQDAVA